MDYNELTPDIHTWDETTTNGAPMPTGTNPLNTNPLDALAGLLEDPTALVGPSGDNTLLMEYNGVDYHIPADLDSESATLTSGDGMNILADTDGDGRVDYVSNIDFDGNWSAWRWGDASGAGQGQENGGVGEEENTPTPNKGKQIWDVGAWKCVERGEWG